MSEIILPLIVLVAVLVFLAVLIPAAKRKQQAAVTAGEAKKRGPAGKAIWIVIYIVGLALGFALMRQL